MRKRSLLWISTLICTAFITLYYMHTPPVHQGLSDGFDEQEEVDGYDEAAARDLFEWEQMKDPALGFVPMERMIKAVDFTENLKRNKASLRTMGSLNWTERGPIYDIVGTNGNSRGTGTNYTAGRTSAILVDTLNDPTGNTVFCGGVSGGLWKCTNFLDAVPNWQPQDDRFDNLAISSICQDPTNRNILYFSTGEGTSNADAVYGAGIWKSVDRGATWSKLATAGTFVRVFKIACDAAGNVYVANRNTSTPVSQSSGLFRTKDGGATWQNITPTGLTSSNTICTDIEISNTGTLHASFGYSGTKVQHLYTDDPANVTSVGWNTSTGIRLSTTSAARLELAVQGPVVYAVTTNSSNNVDSCYKSTDGGMTWTKQNTTAYTTGIANTQGWYDLTLAINPSNSSEIIVGGLDAYKSTNSGATFSRLTYWVTSAPYVHADHHFIQWWNAGTQSRLVIGCDGGVFYSTDGGNTFSDKNRNLAIKQFYSAAIHPDAGSNILLAGAQDNGVHRFTNSGRSWSTEVYGGDGCFVHINQQNPQIQFGSYVYNTYRRSTDGGNTWSSITHSSTNGLFVNPFDYDDAQNIMYASYGSSSAPNNQILRWADANTGSASTILTVNALTRSSNSNATAFKVSTFKPDRVFIGSSRGKLLRLENASTVTDATIDANITDITGSSFPIANLNCINTGTTDNNLVAVFSNYGVQNVWISSDGGTSWTSIDGNLPDMPVRWAVFDPQNNNKMYLATEAGVFYTDAINGAATVWTSDPGFPTVRVNMLKIRVSDNTLVAATHGRGLWTAQIPATPEIRFTTPYITVTEASDGMAGCKGYKDYNVNVSAVAPPSGDATVTYTVQAGNSAIEGEDFDFTTNGSFTTPSKQHVFASGVGGTKTFTIRVYDDATVEADNTFKIGLSVSGTTNAFAGGYSTISVTIRDNDIAPVPAGVGTSVVGTGSYSGGYIQPFRAGYQKAKSQYIYLASELKDAGIAPGNITALGFKMLSKSSTIAYNGLTISLKPTTSTSFSSVVFEDGATPYYSGDYTVVGAATNTFTFNTSFNWDGTSNILVQICYDNITIPGGAGDYVSSHTTTDRKGIWDRETTGTGCSLSAVFDNVSGAYVRPDIIFTGNRNNNSPETRLNATKSAYIGAGTGNVSFLSDNNSVIATVKNLSGAQLGCTEVSIERAGSSAMAFLNNTPANYLMSKAYTIASTSNNTSGQYQVTLYFSAAEKSGWEATTGQTWNNIKIIKVKSKISNYSPGSPQPDGTAGYEAVTPVFGTFGTDYTLTFTSAGTYSGWGAGILNSCTPPAITLQPVTQSVCVGDNASFTVTATGTALAYQWKKDGANISGATNATYTITGASAAHAGKYSVEVGNSSCSALSTEATLTLKQPTAITVQPQGVVSCSGSSADFAVTASGAGTLTYQWRKNGANISGANSATYTIGSISASDNGSYDVVVTGGCGVVTSSAVPLTATICTAVPSIDGDVSGMILMPNLVRSQTVLRLQLQRAMKIDFVISDAQGKVVRSFSRQALAGQNDILLSLEGLASGSYQLSGNTAKGRTEVKRFVKL